MKLGLLPLAALLASGCLVSHVDPNAQAQGDAGAAVVAGDDPTKNTANADAITYRDLATHPGCTTAGLETRKANAYTGATIPGYTCAAKAYPTDKEDPKKPIVLLIHGNSSTPGDWEKFPADSGQPMLAERLLDAGFKVLSVDLRFDKVDDPNQDNKTQNAAQNFDHGWGVPIVQSFVEAVMANWPDRAISMVSFSVGPTMVRDALRRLHRAGKKPFERIQDLVFASGGHHGVSTFRALCGSNPTMRGKVACELGDRTSFTPTDLLKPLNGPGGAWETPCADGDSAFGQKGVCGGHRVTYTTVVMKDIKEGTYQDEFVSEGSSALNGAKNLTVGLGDVDTSGYFYNGLFKNHYGAIRSEAGLTAVMNALTD